MRSLDGLFPRFTAAFSAATRAVRWAPMAEDLPKAPPTAGGQEAVAEAPGAPRTQAATLRGTPLSPGLALGVCHRKDHALGQASLERVPIDGIERELNRFHAAVVDARSQLVDLKQRLAGKVPADDARILDVHAAYLKDSVFISDVEHLILDEQLSLEAAILKVISDFDRIFRLVKNETLRDRAVDLRDVGIRVLRHLEQNRAAERSENLPQDYVLVAHELSIVDMFNFEGNHVLGILTQEGSLTGHAAILARAMGIPTVTGIENLLDTLREGDFVIVDATEGVVRVNPDELLRAQYQEAERGQAVREEGVPSWAAREPRTQDGERVQVAASCGNLPEVEQAAQLGMGGIGLYRTELLYLVDKEPPSVDELTAHYAAVVAAAGGAPVTFRLLHADSSLNLAWLHAGRELNPALGVAGVRALFARDKVLREQLQAILRATPASTGGQARIAVPFLTDTGDLRRIKEVLFEERLELRKASVPFQERVAVGAILETPAAALGARDLARESDFLVLALDALIQHLLAADRDNHELSGSFATLHPMVLRVLRDIAEACREVDRPLSVFGVTATRRTVLPFLIGAGVRSFSVPPAGLRVFLEELARVDAKSSRRALASAAALSCQAEARSLVDGYRHGYARP
jgi:phosphotransferase system enzyme I (PtsI)